MNSINLIGNICADTELKMTQTGKAVCTFRLAVKRPRTKDTTDFFNVVCWNSQAEFVSKYANKGTKIWVTGTLTSRNYEDKNGNKRTAFEIIVDSLGLLESQSNTQGGQSTFQTENSFQSGNLGDFEVVEDTDGDLPF